MNFRSVKLGCRTAVYDPRMPRMGSLLSKGAPLKAPDSIVRPRSPKVQMFGNDTLGDCTAAGIFNSLEVVASLAGFSVPADTSDAVNFYSASTGYVKGDPSTDRGGYEVDVLRHAAQFGVVAAGNTFYPLPWTADPQDFDSMRLSIALTGCAYLGVELAVSDMNEAEASAMDCVLDVDNSRFGDPTPGSEGGHCLLAYEYTGSSDTDTITLVTWGGTKIRCTVRWLKSRIMEQHAILWTQLASPAGLYPVGGRLDKLRADVGTWMSEI